MFSNIYIKYFLRGFTAAFRLSSGNLEIIHKVEWMNHFTILEQDLNTAFNKLKNKYERD